jgi:signal transduction histidine kinase/DNA-binding response OmpR family regulator/HAMP domain-containing protein
MTAPQVKISKLFKKNLLVIVATFAAIAVVTAFFSVWRGHTLNEILGDALFTLVTFIIATIIIYRFFHKTINEPLNKISDYAQKLVEHDYEAPCEVSTNDEFELVASALHYMALDLQGVFERFDEAVIETTEAGMKLQDTLTYLSAVIENMADALLVTAGGRIIQINRMLAEMFELSEKEVINRPCSEVFGPDMMEFLAAAESGAATASIGGAATSSIGGAATSSMGGAVTRAEVKLSRKRVGKASATALRQPQGRPSDITSGDTASESGATAASIGLVVIITDITREKEVDRMKTDFISTVSHELRTPLTSVLGFAEIIKDRLEDNIFPKLDMAEKKTAKSVDAIRGNIGIIIAEGTRLTSLINDVLDIAKMEAGKTDWKRNPVDIKDTILKAAAATSSLVTQKKLKMSVECDDGLPVITGDGDRLQQVMINLISNACKFTDSGSIICRARQDGSNIVVSVSDTGMGILKDDLKLVFEKFKQIGDTLTDKPKGTGLGLPISKQIVEHHGGRIWVESARGEGSTFSFTLPAGASKSAPGHIAASRTAPERATVETSGIDAWSRVPFESILRQISDQVIAGKIDAGGGAATSSRGGAATSSRGGEAGAIGYILVVDDDENIRELLRQELENRGYGVVTARDGVEALGIIEKDRPGLIILDVKMPGISGFDVAAAIKGNPSMMDIPIIILSIIEERERGNRIGVDRYLTKPIDMDALLNDVKALMAKGGTKKKILVIDEDESVVQSVTSVLRTRGYEVAGSSDVALCVELARKLKPDMVIVDASFSDKNGIVQALRFEKDMEDIYFIFTGHGKASGA